MISAHACDRSVRRTSFPRTTPSHVRFQSSSPSSVESRPEGGGKGREILGGAVSFRIGPVGGPFVYRHLGSMAFVGRYKAPVVQLRQSEDGKGISHAGVVSWLVWRSAYLRG